MWIRRRGVMPSRFDCESMTLSLQVRDSITGTVFSESSFSCAAYDSPVLFADVAFDLYVEVMEQVGLRTCAVYLSVIGAGEFFPVAPESFRRVAVVSGHVSDASDLMPRSGPVH